jgi:hypothetical protein
MNPLMAIRGSAETLLSGASADPALRDELLRIILEASEAIERTSLAPEAGGAEERGLRPVPFVEPPATSAWTAERRAGPAVA